MTPGRSETAGQSQARDDVLRRIATALTHGPDHSPATAGSIAAEAGPATTGTAGTEATTGSAAGHPHGIPRAYRTTGTLTGPELLDLLTDRLRDYRATVHPCTPDTLAATVTGLLDTRRVRHLALPPVAPVDLSGWTGHAVADFPTPFTTADLDSVDAVLTGCALAIAETGTIVLDAGPDQGRRTLTLVPDHHVVVVRAAQVVHTVPEAVRRLDPTRPLTWISGPSATSDIELSRVEGVHGPRTLDVVLVVD